WYSASSFFLHRFGKAAALFGAVELAFFLEQRRAALGAFFRHGFVPGHKAALGVVAAAVVNAALGAFAHQHVAAAQRAQPAGVLDEGVGVAALGEAGARHELAVPPRLDDHGAAAFFADLVGGDILD